MKKKIFIAGIIFLIVIIGVKTIDIYIRYDVGLIDYIKYSMPLSDKEKRYIKSHNVKYGINVNDAPFAFSMENSKQNTGIMVDYFNQLSVSLESEFIPVVYESYVLGIELKHENRDCSVLNKNNINNQVFDFTQTLYKERSKVLVGGDSKFENISDVKNIKIAVISGSTAHHSANEFFKKEQKVSLILANDLDECFRMFGLGEVDAIIGDEAKISYYLNQALRANRFRFLEGAVSEEDVAVAVNKENKILFNILNKGILEMKKNNQYSHINAKWFGSFIPEIDDSDDGGKSANIMLLVLFILMSFFIWNKSVADQVAIKTRQLQNSRRELHEIIDSLSDGIAVSNTQGKIIYANRTFASIVGVEFEEIFEKCIDEIECLNLFLRHANDAEPFQIGEKFFLTYQKEINLDSKETLILLKDYTERYRYEKLNKQEAKMIAIGELSAGLSHEIRNPLAIIRSYLFVLSRKISDSDGKEAVEVMDESIERINMLIENLLGFSRLSTDKAVKINVVDSISSMIKIKQNEFAESNITVKINAASENMHRIVVNEDVLKLCMANLINNAIDAFEGIEKEDKSISINIYSDEVSLHIEFSDNACGINETLLDEIFNPFYTTKETGTGLGLYMIQSEIRKIGGTISVESQLGTGTTFFIEFPVGKEENNEQQE